MTSNAELLTRIQAGADEINAGSFDAAPMRALYAAAANRCAAEEAVAAAVAVARSSGMS